ncbi:lysine-specific demethylase 8 [Drosophila willistoni]|nr:lysine-specific demethylase 8 [Drosophila willistoni]
MAMEAVILELAKLFPRFVDIDGDLLRHNVEARYILKRAADYVESLEYHTKDGTDTNEEEIRYLIQALVDINWERIHTGHFSNVSLPVRKIYALGCYFKILFLLLEISSPEQREKCNAILDEAQLLGCTDDWNELKTSLMKHLDDDLYLNDVTSLPILPVVKRCSHRCDIPQIDAPSLNEFRTLCYEPHQPTLLLNTMNHWPAMDKWRNLNYLLKVAGNRTVPIEIGSNYASEEWSQQLVKIRDFLHRQFNGEDEAKEIEYLAQHELFAQIPDLKADICLPDYCTVRSDDSATDVDIKAWLGPAGTISPMHYDPKHNLLCQVFGSKQIILASPKDTEKLYPHQSEFLGNTSQIDAAKLDLQTYPLAESVQFYELFLQPGDCLYMPPKWWHYVQAKTPSFSVSFWWE